MKFMLTFSWNGLEREINVMPRQTGLGRVLGADIICPPRCEHKERLVPFGSC